MVRVKVIEDCSGFSWWFGIYEGKKCLMENVMRKNSSYCWARKSYAIKAAKAMAKRIGIKYDSEIVKQHGC